MFSFYRLAAATPVLRVADTEFNVREIIRLYQEADRVGAAAVVFPELSLCGYTCGDLFFQRRLLNSAVAALKTFAGATAGHKSVALIGLPFLWKDGIYNVAAIVRDGDILGLVPKSVLPNYREFYEKRQFCSGAGISGESVSLGEGFSLIPFGTDLIFESGDFSFGVELCEDLWSVMPPSCGLALAGARAILNLSAGTELAAKAAYRRELVKQQSGRCLCAYLLAGAGVHESTTDAVFGGHALIAANGQLLAENERFRRDGSLLFADVDFERLAGARCSESSFNDLQYKAPSVRRIALGEIPESADLTYLSNPAYPFVPSDELHRTERCREILDIQVAGLAKRLEHTHAKTLVLGISGGLDSTLALLVAIRCFDLLKLDRKNIIAFTLPGFGTTGRTYRNAVALAGKLGVTLREVNITQAALLHFNDIGHNPAELTSTYENVQARERTQILMDVANKTGGMVLGTGDLSELALGWCTYNGDHMSMYAVNASIPKTLIRFLIATIAAISDSELAAILQDIIDTPVSPELLPPSADGKIDQKTEEIIGPYDLHDFFLFHVLKYGAAPDKVRALAVSAFSGRFTEAQIDRTLKIFIRRFFAQQFKRSCMPDGPKVGSIALSPRGDWRMPSDASAALWII